MKQLVQSVVLALGLAVASSAAGQSSAAPAADSLQTLRQEVRADKRAVVERTLDLTPAEAKQFWPLYDRYERALDRIVERQNRVVLDYINAESRLTNANARRLALEMMKADTDEQRLREKQLREVLAVLPAKKAARYIQLEGRIRTIVRYDIAERLPLVQ